MIPMADNQDPYLRGSPKPLEAWIPTCGWGIAGTSAEPDGIIWVQEDGQPTICPWCGSEGCLERASGDDLPEDRQPNARIIRDV